MNPENINADLIIAYLQGELDDAMVEEVDNWVMASEENRKYFESLQYAWEQSEMVMPSPAPVDTDMAWNNLVAHIEKAEAKADAPVRQMEVQKPSIFRILKYAAALIPLLVAGYFLLRNDQPEAGQTLVSAGQVLHDTLTDGTLIRLNKQSTLAWKGDYNKTARRVALSGEAYFEVKRDTSREFWVDTRHLQLRVVGTSFYVNANPGDVTTEVSVTSGMVKLYALQSSVAIDSLLLEAGQRGRLNHSTKKLELLPEPDANQWFWSTRTLVFDKTPLAEVFAKLEEVYHVEIQWTNDSLASLRLTTRFTEMPVGQVMEIIATSFSLTIQNKDSSYQVDAVQH